MRSRITRHTVPNMSCAVSLARSLTERERSRTGSKQQAKLSIARKLSVGVSTIDHLVRGRVKRVDVMLRDKLQALFVRELEQEIARLTNELEIARQGGTPLNSDEVGEIQAHLAAAEMIFRGKFGVRHERRGGVQDGG